MKEEPTMSEEGATVSEEGATVSEEGATVSEEGATMSEEVATMSEEEATVSEDGATMSEGQIDAAGSEESGEALSNGSPIPSKKGRGRPKGSGSKKPKILKVLDKRPRGRPRKVVDPDVVEPDDVSEKTTAPLKRGRPKKVQQPKKRGRPRKTPLSPDEEGKKPKSQHKGSREWKPLGRPRIHPRVDAPAKPTSTEPRGRGRPRKAITDKGDLIRKNPPPTPKVSKPPTKEASARKRGRPLGAVQAKGAEEKDRSNSIPPAKRGCNVSPIVRLYRCSNGKANVLDEAASQAQRQRGRRKTVKVDYTTHDSEEEKVEDAEKK
ncbi:serine/arginine repetitive matrix protein 1 [Esox lucius]|uniref:serine/arginine repetitive matrix protein 1 n=1 Tax=Esox lucius TaxID=8010 RepID=UPI001476B102|nr:serine/arginine repetitive matrix protein 1 [Esox lucius]XP_010899202.2 serine/arginine repetitive matrix protein 1 [Esox lucius]